MDEFDEALRGLYAERRRPMPPDFHNPRRDLLVDVEAERAAIRVRRLQAARVAARTSPTLRQVGQKLREVTP